MANPARPKLAGVVTTYFKYSHAQHIVDRFLEGWGIHPNAPFAVLNAGGNWELKQWPLENFAELAEWMINERFGASPKGFYKMNRGFSPAN